MKKRRTLPYYVVDVFATENFKGNPLAVIFTNGDLSLTEYENISREFGYSETSFVNYSDSQQTLHVRSFTPIGVEVGGAGHNLLGAVSAAFQRGLPGFENQDGRYTVMMENKPITVLIDKKDNCLPDVKMRQKAVSIAQQVPIAVLAQALGIDPVTITQHGLIPTIAQTEVAHLMIPIASTAVLNAIKPDNKQLIQLSKAYGFEGFYCFVFDTQQPDIIAETRFFNPLIGIDEDAATGTAAGPLAGFLCHYKLIQQGSTYQVLQGVQLNQPSLINVIVKEDGIYVGGSSVITMQGEIYL